MTVRRAAGAVAGTAVVLCLVAAVAVTTLGVRVDGTSMAPTLRAGDRVLVAPGSAGRARRFDVVLLRVEGKDALLVKRVIGLPGDRVAIVSTPEEPFQVLLQERGRGPVRRVVAPTWAAQARRTGACCGPEGNRSGRAELRTVPEGSFFYLGDNPDLSDDSRAYGWGEIARIEGRVGARAFPLSAPWGIGNRPALEGYQGPGP
ncbi:MULTISPECIES: signal peptidase I [Streptomyces]|uniref:Signal peptidase I n=1 Tax=Streptomyces venezuelae (strain ATCC 10712 / CBS 650.69 / DSM 40230 / JCM 4526 / NBRC 13096 / PD 04745) TaxID=953739 RepID=F2RB99_STRVP|nr:signal peptidase I [Streptomyces venezuelae]APE20342.1 signal peptidase I [Streptomyces venezuelae]QER97740.1 signal peptidase I [Streptomyces venezuelae ATCC 10712]QES04933.1 signal peptidase I [Streptomyces venezuelae]CCA54227.1 Signal peptidase I [Streptomyces venezuelae ATCC 10712]